MGPSVVLPGPSTIVWRSTGRARDLRGRGDQAALQLTGAPALADHQVAKGPRAGARIPGGQPGRPGPVAELVAAGVVALGGELAVLGVDDQVPAAAGVEAENELAVALAEGVLELVAVAPALDRRLDRLELEALQPAEPHQGVLHLGLLVPELLLVGEALPGSAGTRLAAVVAAGRDAVGRGAQHLLRLGLGVVPLGLGDLCGDAVPG